MSGVTCARLQSNEDALAHAAGWCFCHKKGEQNLSWPVGDVRIVVSDVLNMIRVLPYRESD